MPVLQLENNEILLRVTLRRGGKWGHVLSLVPVMQPLPVRQWNLFAANSKSWEWHENWQNKYAGARPKKDGVILLEQLVTFFHSLYLTTKNALPWSKINYGLELVIPWKQTILYHGTYWGRMLYFSGKSSEIVRLRHQITFCWCFGLIRVTSTEKCPLVDNNISTILVPEVRSFLALLTSWRWTSASASAWLGAGLVVQSFEVEVV